MGIKRKPLNKNAITLTVLAAAYAVIAAALYTGNASRQLTNMLIPISVYIVLAVSLNLVVGFLGDLSLGHAGFMLVGLFSGCLLSIEMVNDMPGMPLFVRLPLCMIFGGLIASVFGLVVGLPVLRLKGDYLAIVTLACGEIIKDMITNLNFTGGALGLDSSPIYSNAKTLLPFAIILVFITVIVMMNLKKSKHGRAIMAIRDNRIAAESIGLNITKFKLAVFIMSAFFAGAAGTLYGHFFANVKATSFDFNTSIELLVIVVLGGLGSISGTIIAAVVLQALPEVLRDFNDYRMLIYSVVLIIVMLATNNPTLVSIRKRFVAKVKGVFKKGGAPDVTQ